MRVSRASALVVQKVRAADADWFLAWQHEVAADAAGFTGYRGTDVFAPSQERTDEWVVAMHFDDDAALQRWLDSPVRLAHIERLRARIGDFELKNLPGGFGGWFAGMARASGAAPPPGWRMALTVLLGLYPTVMLLALFPGPHLRGLGLATSMLIGNAMSCVLLQWAVMPLVTKLVAPFLRAKPDDGARSIGGAVAIALSLGVLVLVFRRITG